MNVGVYFIAGIPNLPLEIGGLLGILEPSLAIWLWEPCGILALPRCLWNMWQPCLGTPKLLW